MIKASRGTVLESLERLLSGLLQEGIDKLGGER